jgi:hypothetical protein
MANALKEGLDYFSFDVDFFNDEKIEFISARFGTKGELITVKLLCKLYRKSYYMAWSDDENMLFAKRAGEAPSLVNEIIQELVRRGFFDESLLNRFNILTSKGIQKRYLNAVVRRKSVIMDGRFLLINPEDFKNVNINLINVNINKKNEDINPQSKVKESKVKEKNGAPPTHSPEENEQFKTFENWIHRVTPRVAKMKKPFTIQQFLKIKKLLNGKQISDLLKAMENRADLLKKYESAYLTLTRWSKNDWNNDKTLDKNEQQRPGIDPRALEKLPEATRERLTKGDAE